MLLCVCVCLSYEQMQKKRTKSTKGQLSNGVGSIQMT